MADKTDDPRIGWVRVTYSIPVRMSDAEAWVDTDLYPIDLKGHVHDTWMDEIVNYVSDQLPDLLERAGGPTDVEFD